MKHEELLFMDFFGNTGTWVAQQQYGFRI